MAAPYSKQNSQINVSAHSFDQLIFKRLIFEKVTVVYQYIAGNKKSKGAGTNYDGLGDILKDQ